MLINRQEDTIEKSQEKQVQVQSERDEIKAEVDEMMREKGWDIGQEEAKFDE